MYRVSKIIIVLIVFFLYIRTYIKVMGNFLQVSFITDSLCLILIFFAYSLRLKRRSLILFLCCFVVIFSPVDLYEGISNNKIFYLFRKASFFNYNRVYSITLSVTIIAMLLVVFESFSIIIGKGVKKDKDLID